MRERLVKNFSRIAGIGSLVLIGLSVILLIYPGLPLGIDFQAGSVIVYEWQEDAVPDLDTVRDALGGVGHGDAQIQSLGDTQYFIRTTELAAGGKAQIDNALATATGVTPTTIDSSSVSSTVASETIIYSIVAVVVASVFVMLYIMFAFRHVSNFYRYAVGTVVALVHDVLITMGIFILFGLTIGAEVNIPFVVALLTIVGYSVNDTIVVFDRVRENIKVTPGRNFRANVRNAVRESLIRSLGTSFTTLVVSVALLLFGGVTLRDFLLVLVIGVVVGTYSSLVIATGFVVLWQEHGIRGLTRRLRLTRRGAAEGS